MKEKKQEVKGNIINNILQMNEESTFYVSSVASPGEATFSSVLPTPEKPYFLQCCQPHRSLIFFSGTSPIETIFSSVLPAPQRPYFLQCASPRGHIFFSVASPIEAILFSVMPAPEKPYLLAVASPREAISSFLLLFIIYSYTCNTIHI